MSVLFERRWRRISIPILIVIIGTAISGVLFSGYSPPETEIGYRLELNQRSDAEIAFEPLTASPYWQQFGNNRAHKARSGLRGSQSDRLRWTYDAGDSPVDSISISGDDKVALCTSPDYSTGYMYWVDMDDGALNWSRDFYGETTHPALSADSEVAYTVAEGDLCAIDSSGSYIWSYYLGYSGNETGPTVGDDGTVYAGCEDRFYAINSSGGLDWSYSLPYYMWHLTQTPAVTSDGFVYFATNENKVYALNSSGGHRWTYNVDGRIDGVLTLSEDGNNIYFGTGDHKLLALDTAGSLDWSFDTRSSSNVVGSVAVDSDGAIVFGASNGEIITDLCVLRSDGTLRWSLPLSGPIKTSPAIDADGSIYFDFYRSLYSVNSFGLIKWSYNTGSYICACPSIGPYETVIFGADDDRVYCLESLPRLSDGRVTPSVGDDSDSYTYWVHYFSPAERAPNLIRVNITLGDGTDYDMTLHTGDAHNGLYYADGIVGPERVGAFEFRARDKSDAPFVYLPSSGRFPGPIVDNDGDDYESDDSCEEAQSNGRTIQTNGTPQHRTLLPGDMDWVQFDAQKYLSYFARTVLASSDCGTNLYIYDPSCSIELAFDGGSGPDGGSAIAWTCQSSGTYFLGVEHSQGTDGVGEYYLSIEIAHWPVFKCASTRRSRSPALGCPGDNVDWSKAGFADDRMPVVDMTGNVYCENSSGWLYCLNSAGAAQWSYDANLADYTNVSIAPSGNIYLRSQNSYIHALASDGGFRWSYGIDDDSGGLVALSADEDVYFGRDNRLIALESDGSFDWTFNSKHDIAAPPAIGIGGRLYFGNTFGFLFSLESDGSFVWYKDLEQGVSTTPLVNSTGDVVTLTDDGFVFCFGADGDFNWSYECESGDVTSAPALGLDDRVLARIGTNKLFCLTSDGSFDWRYLGMMDLHSTPAVDRDGHIYVGRQGIKCLNPDGTLRWTHSEVGLDADSSPAIGPDGAVYLEVGTSLYKFAEEDVDLSGGSVDPDQGQGSTEYHFDVSYESTAAPEMIQVYIDGAPFDMSLEEGNANSGLYRYQPSGIDEGTHEFYFCAESPTGRWDRDPESGTYDGPLVDDTPPESATDSPVYRTSGGIPVDFEAADDPTGIDVVSLYYAFRDGDWTLFDSVSAKTGTAWCDPVHGDGEYHFCSRATDGAGNQEDFPQDPDCTTIYDATRPTSSCTSPQSTNDSPFGVAFNADDETAGVAEVELWFNKDGGAWNYYDTIADAKEGTFDFTPSGQGEYGFYTRAADHAGNVEDPSASADSNTIYDTTLPSSDCTSASFASSSPFNVDFTADDNASGVAEVSLWFSKDGSAWTYYDAISDTTDGAFDFTPSGEGEYRFYTRAEDHAGNVEDAPGTPDSYTVYDATDPDSYCSSPSFASTSPFDVDFVADDETTGVAEVGLWFSKDGGAWTFYDTIPDETQGAFAFAPPGDGEYQFYTRATDHAGNVEEPPGAPDSATVYDSTKPASWCDSPQYDPDIPIPVDYQAYAGGGTSIQKVELYFRFEEAEYRLFGDQSYETGTFDFDAVATPGTYCFYTIAYDEVGNVEDPPGEPDSETVFDDVAPTSACTSPEFVTGATIAVTFSAADSHSGIAQVDLLWKTQGAAWEVFDTVSNEDSGTVGFNPPGDDKYFFAARAKDHADNQEDFDGTADSQTVYDTQRPASDCDAPQYASGATIAVSYTADDAESGVKNVKLWYRLEGGTWTYSGHLSTDSTVGVFQFLPEDYANTGFWAGDTDGKYDFFTIAYDHAGWPEEPPASPDASTIHDTTEPESTCSSPDFSTSASIIVSFAATDITAGIASVDLYYTQDGSGPVLWATSTEGTVGAFDFVAPSPGYYDFFTIAQDLVGNKEGAPGAPDCQTIYDDLSPTSEASCDAFTNASPIPVSFEAEDDAAGLDRVELYIKGGAGWMFLDEAYAASGTFDVSLPSEGVYEFATIAYDLAGNHENFPSQPDCSCTLDTTDPASVCYAPQYSNAATFNVDYDAQDVLSGIDQVEVYLKDGADWVLLDAAPGASVGTFQVTFATEGVYEFATVAHDFAGNVEGFPEDADCSCLLDMSSPSSVCFAPQYSTSATIAVDFDAQDELSGLGHVELYLRGPLGWVFLDTQAGATEGTFGMTCATEGVYEFATVAFDIAGNAEDLPPQPDCSCTFDVSSPSSICYAPDFAGTPTFEIGFEANDGGSGVAVVSLFHSSDIDETWRLYSESTIGTVGSFTYDVPLPNERHVRYFFSTRAADNAGNNELPPTTPDAETIYDSAAPTTSCIVPPYASLSTIEVEFAIDERLAGVDWAKLYYQFGSDDWKEGSQPTTATVGAFAFLPLDGDGLYEFSVEAADRCGNVAFPPDPCCSATYDTIKPVSTCSSDSFVTASSVELSFTASDELSGLQSVGFWYKYADGVWRETALVSSDPSGVVSFIPPDGDGIYRFYSRAVDNAGNREDAPADADCVVVIDRSLPVLLIGRVNPQAGTPDFDYTFSVVYRDADGAPPSESTVVVDGVAWPMTLATGDPADGTYSYTTQLSGGVHAFFFYFIDAYGLDVRLPTTGAFSGPTINSFPNLDSGEVEPTVGDTETVFEFSVDYHDDDGDEPLHVQVVIDGTPSDMAPATPATREPYDMRYSYIRKLAEGPHNFFFRCQDLNGASDRLPAVGQYAGPEVSAFDDAPPYCRAMAPAPGETDVPSDTTISLEIVDDTSGVDPSSVEMTVGGVVAIPSVMAAPGGYHVSFTPTRPFPQRMVVAVTVSVCDTSIRHNCLDGFAYSFTVEDVTPPMIIPRSISCDAGANVAVVEWVTNEPADSLLEYFPEGGLTSSTDSTVMRCFHTLCVRGLTPATTYHYRVASTDEAGNGPTYSDWRVFATLREPDESPPVIVAGPAATVFETSITIVWATDEPATSSAEISTSPEDVSRGRKTRSIETDEEYSRRHTMLMSGLEPNTTYYARVISADMSGNTVRSGFFEFATLGLPDTRAPEILEGPRPIYVSDSIAIIGWTVDELALSWVQFGMSDSYGQTTSDHRISLVHGIILTGLLPDTEYHYKVFCKDLMDNGPSSSADLTFTTLADPDSAGLFCVSGPEVTYLTDELAKIEWETNRVSDTRVLFWEVISGPEEAQPWRDGRFRRLHEAFLGNLSPNTTYRYIISSTDPLGNSLASPQIGAFTTPLEPDTQAPAIAGIGLSYNAQGKVRIDWHTSEPADSRIEFWELGSRQRSKGSWAGSENKQDHSGWLGDLDVGLGYEYRVGSSDSSGNTSWSASTSFTPNREDDVLSPSFKSGPDVETRRGPAQLAVVWTTSEIADTQLVYWKQAPAEMEKFTWASYEHSTDHRVELNGLEPGAYEFEASSRDPAGNSTQPQGGTFSISGSAGAPRLSNPYVEPVFGSPETNFTYCVNYIHPDGTAPQQANVVIDGNRVEDMLLAQGAPNDGVYELTAKLSAGTHTFVFKFQSSAAEWVMSPESGAYEGPVVTDIPDFTISVRTDSNIYQRGDMQTVVVDAANKGDSIDVDLYACLLTPGGELLFWPAMSTDAAPFPLTPFPGHSSFLDYELHTFAIPADWAVGDYTWFVGLAEPGTWDTTCKIATSIFTISSLELDLTLNDTVFIPGDEMIVNLSLSNLGDEIDADLYVYVTLPNEAALYLPGFTTEATPFALNVPVGFSYTDYEMFRITMMEGLPDGRYTWSAFLNEHGLSERLSNITSADFEIFNVRLTMSVNKTDFGPGDEFIASVAVENYGPEIYLELFSWVIAPDGAFYYIPRLDTIVSPVHEFSPLPEGAKYDAISVLEMTLPDALPNGAYCIQAALLVPGNESHSGKIAEAWFAFSND